MANTGTKIVLQLKKVEQGTTTPTIETKANTVGDPDYIAPYVSADCPVTYDVVCPTTVLTDTREDVKFEFALTDSTINNPDVNTLTIQLFDSTNTAASTSIVFERPFTNFFTGSFAAPGYGFYSYNITFLNSTGGVVGTPCTGLSQFEIIDPMAP